MQQALEGSPEKSTHACRAGCSSCCSQLIPVTPFEAFIIATHIKQNFKGEHFKNLVQKLKMNAQLLDSNSAHKFGTPRVPCALLDYNGACSIHLNRPIRCRGYFSSSKKNCDAQVNQPEIEIPVDGHSLALSRGVQSSLSKVLSAYRLDAEYYELQSAVYIALNQKHALKKWLKGEKIFSNCLKSQSHPKIIWVAPQSNQETVVLSRNDSSLQGKKIDVQTFYD